LLSLGSICVGQISLVSLRRFEVISISVSLLLESSVIGRLLGIQIFHDIIVLSLGSSNGGLVLSKKGFLISLLQRLRFGNFAIVRSFRLGNGIRQNQLLFIGFRRPRCPSGSYLGFQICQFVIVLLLGNISGVSLAFPLLLFHKQFGL